MVLKPPNPGFGYTSFKGLIFGAPGNTSRLRPRYRNFHLAPRWKDNAGSVRWEHACCTSRHGSWQRCLIEVNGPEIYIIDGSPFVKLLKNRRAGTGIPPKYNFHRYQYFLFMMKAFEMTALLNQLRITTVSSNSPVLGTQHASIKIIKDFQTEIAPTAHSAFYMNWKCWSIITWSRAAISTMPS